MQTQVPFDALKGLTLTTCYRSDPTEWEIKMFFETTDGRKFEMYHEQACCEAVDIEDINGDPASILGDPIMLAEESKSHDMPGRTNDAYSQTWTFYRLATIHGYLNIRWYGSSNGYYSETVDLYEITPG